MSFRSAISCRALAIGLALTAPTLHADAQDPAFALAFPITPPAGETLFAIELPPEAYATLTTSDLSDLAVVDSEGRFQSLSIQRAARMARADAPVVTPVAAPIRMPREAARSAETLDLHVRRDRDGRLVALDLATGPALAPDAPEEWLIDLSAAEAAGYDGLRLVPPPGSADFRVRVTVLGSDDLTDWDAVAQGLPLLRVTDGARAIERLELAFGRVGYRYLTIRPEGATGLPAVEGLRALRHASEPASVERQWDLASTGRSADGLRYEFPSPGALPVSAVALAVSEPNGLHEFTLRQRIDGQWAPVLKGTAWQIEVDGDVLRSGAFAVGLPGIGPLQVETRQPAQPPRLTLTYRPDEVLVLASGSPPYRLLAGSGRFRHTPTSMTSALAAVRARQGDDWTPPRAALGPAQALDGETALRSGPPIEPGRIALWGVLGIGALLVGGTAWRLLREAPEAKID